MKKILHALCMIGKYYLYGFVVQLLFLNLIYAAPTNAQGSLDLKKVYLNLSLEEASLSETFNAIKNQTEFSFIYDQQLLENAYPVNMQVQNQSLEEILLSLAASHKLSFKQVDDKISVMLTKKNRPEEALIVEVTVSGTVVDATGEPIPGVTVSVPGTSIGTATDIDGKYILSVPEESTLVFSFIGFETQRITVGDQSIVNVTLHEDMSSLDEVVVVGYGTQKESNITGAMAFFNAEKLEERPLTRVDQAIVGQMAGVHVKQTTGVPGKAFSIQVRGSGSISAGNEPLYVIDGFPLAQASPNASGSFTSGNPLDNINPNDIESIQVLKDAASAAIYGSRAANGVVLITTKTGRSGKPQITFNTYAGFSEPSRKLDMLSPEEWIERAIEMHDDAWIDSAPGRTANQTTAERGAILGLQEGDINSLLMIDDRWIQPGYPGLRLIDWQDEFFKKGLMQNYQLSASGGNEFINYYVSGNYVSQEGMVLGMDYTSYSARVNVDLTPNKKLKFGINLTPTYSVSNDPGVEGNGNVIQTGILFSPVQEEDVGLYPNSFDNGQYRWGTSPASPIAILENRIGQTKRFRTLTSIYGEYQIMEGLAFRTTANLDNIDNNNKSYRPYTITGNLASRQNQPGLGTSGSFMGYRKQTFVNENTLSYNKIINNVHDLSVLVGASYNSDKLDNVSLSSVNGYGSSVITTLNAASAVNGNTTETKNVLLSYFGRLQYALSDKYLFSASLRRDGSSRFGSNTKWGWFPSASIGWRISEESFLKNIEIISDLKLRASWGKSGNYNIGDYSSIPLLRTNNYSFNGTQVFGQSPGGIINPDLSWETSKTSNFGLDIGILENRIVASFDIYSKTNSDLLLNVPIPANTGFLSYLNNAGKVRNKGWEIELNTRNLTGDFQWTTSFNFSHNTNKVLELPGGQTQILIPSSFDIPHSILKIGEPMYSINVVKQVGILTQEDINSETALFGPQTIGDPKYFDANGDGVIDANDRVIVGHPMPDYIWGVTNTFRFKGFDLSTLLQGQWGGSIYSLLGRAVRRTGQDYSGNVLGVNRDRWRSPDNPGNGTDGKAYSNFGRIKNTDWLYSSDYWRIRNITLGYNLGTLINPKYITGARIYITAENWFGKDKYYGGFNPEASNTDLSGSSTFPEPGDYGGLPLAKSLIIGLNLTF